MSTTANDCVETLLPKARTSDSTYADAAAPMEACELRRDDINSHFDVNWDKIGFGLTPTDYMYIIKYSIEEKFSQGTLSRFGNIEMNPSSGILNYGQGIIEGLKAYRAEDGRILLFRPEQNAVRLQMGAERLCMPSPTVEQFLDAVKQTVIANKRWVPPPGKGSLYIRPLLIASEPILAPMPATEYTFLVYASPVGNYHKGALNLVVEEKFHRAFPGGTGGIKAISNYSTVYKAVAEAKAKGFSDVLFVDVITGRNIEEASSCNIFVLKGNVISTPAIDGTILPGVTRKSIIEIARVLGYEVEERTILVEELFDAEEVFCTGTAVVVNPVCSITYRDKRIQYETGVNTVSQNLHAMLTRIQTGQIQDKMGWTVELI